MRKPALANIPMRDLTIVHPHRTMMSEQQFDDLLKKFGSPTIFFVSDNRLGILQGATRESGDGRSFILHVSLGSQVEERDGKYIVVPVIRDVFVRLY